MKRLALLLLGTVTAALSTGQSSLRISDVLDGKTIPAVIKPKDLGSDYWAVKLVMTGEFNFLDLYGGLAFQSFGDSSSNSERQRAKEAVSQAAGVYWTKGEKLNIEGRDYLIAYRLDIPIAAIGGNSRSFDSWAMENPLDLTLQLIRPESIGRMTPVPSLTPERMAKGVAAFERSLAEELGVPPGTLVQGAGSSQSRQTAALSNGKQIGLGIMIYSSDYDDVLPPKPSTANVRNIVRPYLKNDAIWKTGNPNKSEFLYNPALAGVSQTDIDEPAKMPMIYESAAWPDGRRVVVYADSHAKLVPNAEWQRIALLLKAKIKRSTASAKPATVVSRKPAPRPKPKK